jgi:tRNA(Ile)-lysidine synthase
VLDRVLKTISRYNMLPQHARVIVAVSGGADSVCLLHVLRELTPASVAGIAHFNHKWRAAASDEDEHFVAALAAQLGLPFFRAEAPPGISTGNKEQHARRDRQNFFRSLPSPIALGHTRDDQAETVLFRFLRGSGLAGLAGIAPVAEGIIRPLIDVTRADVEKFLLARQIPWREDATNADVSFARNRIRHQLLPQLAAEWNPQIHQTLSQLADLAQEEESYWTSEIDRLAATHLIVVRQIPDLPAEVELPTVTLTTLPRALARRLIRRAIALAKGDLRRIDYHHVEAVFHLQRRLRLPGVSVTRSFDWLRFSSSAPAATLAPIKITPPGIYPSPDGLTQICVDLAQPGESSLEPPSKACATLGMEACGLYSPLELRGWQPGDHYRPQGHSRDHKIKEMFQKARVPSWRRASWPILSSGDRILWSRQFGVAHEFAEQAVLRIGEVSLS